MRPLILLAAPLALVACAVAFPSPTTPVGLRPVPSEDVSHWAASTQPQAWVMMRFGWRKRDSEGSNGGRGYAFFAPPDSIRVYVGSTLGIFRGDAAVVGDSALWAEPREEVEKLVPSYHLLWALLGVARPPAAGWATESRQDAKTMNSTVRYTHGADTVEYVAIHGGQSRLETRVVVGGKPIGQVSALFDQLHHISRSRLTVLTSPVQLDITFDSVTKQQRIDKESWNAPTGH